MPHFKVDQREGAWWVFAPEGRIEAKFPSEESARTFARLMESEHVDMEAERKAGKK